MEQARSILQHCRSSFVHSLTSSSLVISISQLLYAEECINERALDEIESPETSLDDKQKVLLAAIETAVFIDYRKLNVVATVLSKFGETKSIANSIRSNWSKLFIASFYLIIFTLFVIIMNVIIIL